VVCVFGGGARGVILTGAMSGRLQSTVEAAGLVATTHNMTAHMRGAFALCMRACPLVVAPTVEELRPLFNFVSCVGFALCSSFSCMPFRGLPAQGRLASHDHARPSKVSVPDPIHG